MSNQIAGRDDLGALLAEGVKGMTGPHRVRRAGACDRCGGNLAVGENYYAGRAKCLGWRSRFATERICAHCVENQPITYERGFGPGDGDSRVIEP